MTVRCAGASGGGHQSADICASKQLDERLYSKLEKLTEVSAAVGLFAVPPFGYIASQRLRRRYNP